MQFFGITVTFNDIQIEPPSKKDQWLMAALLGAGFPAETLPRLNRVRLHQQVLFLSDILEPAGKKLESRYITQRQDGEYWSRLKFPNKKPPAKDFCLWAEAVQVLVPADGLPDILGAF